MIVSKIARATNTDACFQLGQIAGLPPCCPSIRSCPILSFLEAWGNTVIAVIGGPVELVTVVLISDGILRYPGCGTLFRMTTSGTLTKLDEFCSSGCPGGPAYPDSGLFLATNGYLYGTTYLAPWHGHQDDTQRHSDDGLQLLQPAQLCGRPVTFCSAAGPGTKWGLLRNNDRIWGQRQWWHDLQDYIRVCYVEATGLGDRGDLALATTWNRRRYKA